MAVTSDPFIASDLAGMIPDLWVTYVLEELFAKYVLANFVHDYTQYAASGGSTFEIPDVFTNTFTVQSQSTQGAEITTAGPAQVKVQLAIDTHKYIAMIIGDKDQAQLWSSYDFNGVYGRKIGSLLHIALEDALTALWSSLSTNLIGDTATQLVDAEIRQGIEKLATGKADLRDCAFFIHTYVFWVQLSSVAKYYDASQVGLLGPGQGGGAGFVRTGNFGPMDASRGLSGTFYGIPIFTTPEIVSGLQTYRNLLLHRDALGFGTQTPGGSVVRIQAENAIRNLGMLTVADILYGVKVVREPLAVLLNASSAFIGS